MIGLLILIELIQRDGESISVTELADNIGCKVDAISKLILTKLRPFGVEFSYALTVSNTNNTRRKTKIITLSSNNFLSTEYHIDIFNIKHILSMAKEVHRSYPRVTPIVVLYLIGVFIYKIYDSGKLHHFANSYPTQTGKGYSRYLDMLTELGFIVCLKNSESTSSGQTVLPVE